MLIISTMDHARKEMHAIASGPVNYADVEAHLLQERRWQGLPYPRLIDARARGYSLPPTFATSLRCSEGWERNRISVARPLSSLRNTLSVSSE
jgi:hypothetical protein